MAEKAMPGKIPEDCAKDLSLLYMRSLELSNMAPKDALRLYLRVYNEISVELENSRKAGWH